MTKKMYDKHIYLKALEWTKAPFDEETQKQTKDIIDNNPKELFEAFHKNISFGTGGIREIMGVGTNRINKYTISLITQGLSNHLKEKHKNSEISAVIAFDCRNNSIEFAKQTANILTANGIKTFIFNELAPTPLLSFAIRKLKCSCGIIITASHNPKEYNGYKVYDKSGAQITPPQDRDILNHINSINISDINFKSKPILINKLDKQIDKEFISTSVKYIPDINIKETKNIKIVFTPLHGTSIRIIPKLLEYAGFNSINILKSQSTPDGNFTNASSPNPEEKKSFDKAIELSKNIDGNIIIATDPDADRIGIVIKDKNKNFEILNGNQIGAIITDYLLNKLKQKNLISINNFISSTVVSSDIFLKIAKKYNIECKQTLTGFKWIGKMVSQLEKKEKIIIGIEESHGYMIGDFVRDKDALTSSLIISSIAQEDSYKSKNLLDRIVDIYIKYGFFKESLMNIALKGAEGRKKINDIMNNIRENKPKKIIDIPINQIIDFKENPRPNNTKLNIYNNTKSNLIIIYTNDDTKIAIRPSDTEPKIKFYISVQTTLTQKKYFHKTNIMLIEKIKNIETYLKDNFIDIF